MMEWGLSRRQWMAYPHSGQSVESVALSPDGQTVAADLDDGRV